MNSRNHCICGKLKDSRAKHCSLCAKRSYLIGGWRFTKKEVEWAVSSTETYVEAAKILGCSRTTVSSLCKKHGISTGHMRRARGRTPSDEHIFSKSEKRRNATVKSYILKNSLLPYVCACGQLPFWNNKPLTLHLEHLDGDGTNNVRENLLFLCPNCHAQTDTYCGKSKKKERIE